MTTLQTILARALVRIAVAVLPQTQADKLRAVTRPIWRPGQQ